MALKSPSSEPVMGHHILIFASWSLGAVGAASAYVFVRQFVNVFLPAAAQGGALDMATGTAVDPMTLLLAVGFKGFVAFVAFLAAYRLRKMAG